MSDTLFQEGKSSNLFLRNGNESSQQLLIKKTSFVERSHPGNAALYNEYKLLKGLKLDGVRKTVALEHTQDGPELILEFIDGTTLNQAFAQVWGGLYFFLDVAVQICEVLEKIHRLHIVHKDLNPDNILLNVQTKVVTVIDFGISSKLDLKMQHLGNPEHLEGTLHYMSPEQTGRMDRIVDNRSDLYSLGVLFYELLSGKKPFNGKTALELVHSHVAGKAESLKDQKVAYTSENQKVPTQLNSILFKLLEKNAENRYKNVGGLKFDLIKCRAQWQKNGAIENFQIGKRDYSATLRIPEKLYGMQGHIDFLKQLFNTSEQGQSQVVMLRGFSGVGKSSLARELHKLLAGVNGRFITGKFEQLQKDVPHFALAQALNELVDLLLTENGAVLKVWKERILSALGDLGKVITDLIPSLTKIIGEQPDVPELTTTENKNRREYLLRSFVKCLSRPNQPLVVFIDDLQWADEASLELFEKLLIDKESKELLFIGAYRDNAVDTMHPLAQALSNIKSERKIEEIYINNLSEQSVLSLIEDTLGTDSLRLEELTTLVYQKTKGNAFFALQFLKALYHNNKLIFDSATYQWSWDLADIEAMGITDNVVDLLSKKIDRLDPDVINILELAACIGNRFDISTVNKVLEDSPEHCLELLNVASAQELIAPVAAESWRLILVDEYIVDELEFAFVHDKIQQALYQRIPEEKKQRIHLKIARNLYQSASKSTLDAIVFDICSQVNYSLNLIEDQEEKTLFANINLRAGKKARTSSAYKQALKFLESGISLLPSDAWKSDYSLCLQLHLEAMESAYLVGNHVQMEELMRPILKEAKSMLDKMPVYHVKVDAYTAQHLLPKAVEAGVTALAELGVHFPESPKLFHVFLGLGTTKMKLGRKKIEQLIYLPEMTDPYMLEAMPLMERISPAAYMSGSQLFPLLVFKMVDISLKYGNSVVSAFGYASFAITLSGVLGDYDGGYKFANLSLKLLDRFKNETFKVKVYFVNYCFVRHWKEHSNEMISPLMDAHRSGMQVGNLFSANWVACYALIWKYYSAHSLADLHHDLMNYSITFRQLKQDGAYNLANILELTVQQLLDSKKVNAQLGGSKEAEEELLQRCEKANDKTALFFIHLNKMQLSYWFNELEDARESSNNAEQLLEAVIGLHYIPQYYFYDALIRLADPKRLAKDNKKVRASIKKLKTWTKHAPMNYAHKLHLVQAEHYRVKGEEGQARKLYDLSISEARKNNYTQEEALAYERSSSFYYEIGINHLGKMMRNRAVRFWNEWGAIAKLRQLNTSTEGSSSFDGTVSVYQTMQTLASSTGILDKESILKASHILSGEIDSQKLIVSFMEVMIENTGADNGVLLLKEDDKWVVKAKVALNEEKVELLNTRFESDNLSAHSFVPVSVINYVVNSKQEVILNNVEQENNFKKDPYLLSELPKSLIGYPLLNKNELVGVLYLENKLSRGVFHVERIEILNVLGAQIAVSLENARLYSKTKELNVAYERFVPKEFLSFLNKTSITHVQLGDQVQKEMTILFSDIRGFTTLSEVLSPQESFKFINEYLSVMEPHIAANGGFIDKYIGDAIMALFPGSPDQALDASFAMIDELKRFNSTNETAKKYPLSFGIGMHTGRLILGTVGAKGRMDSTVISDSVNIASRVEGLTKSYKSNLLITEATLNELVSPGRFKTNKVGDEVLKGKTTIMSIYEVLK